MKQSLHYQAIFPRDVVKLVVNACVHHVRKRFAEKMPSFKSIAPEILIFLDNAVINSIALRVGEIVGQM